MSVIEAADDDTIRVLIATDIHLGYGEKNNIKKDDSFDTFEEILQIAIEQKVDMLLLGGDLFHDNKPSRNAEMRCVELLRKYVLGDQPISLELLSDPNENFKNSTRKDVNYADPNLNIGLPVFTIHGNHDDPCGLGGHSCIDILHSMGLVNYFGRIDSLNEIVISPLLLAKGNTKLALYGLSSIKDERLHRLFRDGNVVLKRPNEDRDNWFNIMVLHQNRVKHGATSYIPEHFLEDFIDLAFWGHEHECRLEPEEAVCGNKNVYITQPGSSVATSLCEAESKDKMVGILEIKGTNFKINPIPLKTVRPLIFQTINLEESDCDLYGTEKQVQDSIQNYLCTVVEEMINEASNKLTGHPKQPKLPLLRLRVEYLDPAHQLTPGRFGNLFHDKVANPSEILLFKKKVERKKNDDKENYNPDLMNEMYVPEELRGSSMDKLLADYFKSADEKTQLKVLGINGISVAVNQFVDKDDKDAISLIVSNQIDSTFKKLVERDTFEQDQVDKAIEEVRSERSNQNQNEIDEARMILSAKARPVTKSSNNDPFNEDSNDDEQSTSSVSRISSNASNSSVKENSQQPTPVRGGRGRGRGRGSRGGRAQKKPVATNSIQDAFKRQSQNSQMSSSSTTRRSSRSKLTYISDSD